MIFRAQTQSLFQIRVYSRLPAVVCEGWVFSGPAPDATCPPKPSTPPKRLRRLDRRRQVVSGQWSCSPDRFASLLRHHFELCIDHLVGEAVNRHMRPVMLFAFNNEIVLQIGSIPFQVAGLPNYVEHQIPNAPLINFPKSLGDRFAQSGSCEHFTLP
jgi:hypothetical protein